MGKFGSERIARLSLTQQRGGLRYMYRQWTIRFACGFEQYEGNMIMILIMMIVKGVVQRSGGDLMSSLPKRCEEGVMNGS